MFHQAAHKAVLRSVEHPLITDTVNTHGTLTVLKAALDAGVRRVVHASSSSVYGGAAPLPTPETAPAAPRSPYAVSKLAAEQYCRVFAELLRARDGRAALLQRVRPAPAPRRHLRGRDPALRRRAAQRPRRRSCTATGCSRATSRTSPTSSHANLARAGARRAVVRGPRVQHRGRQRARRCSTSCGILGELLGVEPHPQFVEAAAGDVRHSRADRAPPPATSASVPRRSRRRPAPHRRLAALAPRAGRDRACRRGGAGVDLCSRPPRRLSNRSGVDERRGPSREQLGPATVRPRSIARVEADRRGARPRGRSQRRRRPIRRARPSRRPRRRSQYLRHAGDDGTTRHQRLDEHAGYAFRRARRHQDVDPAEHRRQCRDVRPAGARTA